MYLPPVFFSTVSLSEVFFVLFFLPFTGAFIMKENVVHYCHSVRRSRPGTMYTASGEGINDQ